MKVKYDIYKIIYSKDNNNLIEQINDCFKNNLALSAQQLKAIKIASSLASKAKLSECHNSNELNDENSFGYDVIYFAVNDENKIISKFAHSYYKEFNQIYLDQADTFVDYANKGLGTKIYKKVIADIEKTFSPSTICADAISGSGKRFLEKVGFLPNTHPDSKDTNAIYYLKGKKMFLIELSDLPEIRNFSNAPNIELYNSILSYAKMQEYYSPKTAKEIFNKIYNSRQTDYKISAGAESQIYFSDMISLLDFDFNEKVRTPK